MKRVRRANSEEVPDPNVIECRLCHKDFRAITFLHLRRIHGFQGDHPIQDYKRRFDLETATCRATRRALRKEREDYWERLGLHWTRQRLIETLRKRARAGKPLHYASLEDPLNQALRRHFGTWERAMRRAGLDPESHRLFRNWDADLVVAAIAERHAAGLPLSMSSVASEDAYLYGASIRWFRSWGRALTAAGFDPKVHRVPKKWNLDHARDWVRAAAKKGRSLLVRDVPRGLYVSVLRKVPGGWPTFLESVGIQYSGPIRRDDWSAAAVLKEIRRRRRSGKPLNVGAVVREGQAVVHQARNYFGTWDDALRAAGIDPLSVRLSRTWSRQDVLWGILARHAAGRPMDHRSAREDEPRLVKAAQKAFPSSWAKALAAAGLDPRPPRGPRARRRVHDPKHPRSRKGGGM